MVPFNGCLPSPSLRVRLAPFEAAGLYTYFEYKYRFWILTKKNSYFKWFMKESPHNWVVIHPYIPPTTRAPVLFIAKVMGFLMPFWCLWKEPNRWPLASGCLDFSRETWSKNGPNKRRLDKLWSDVTQIYSETLDLSFYKNSPAFVCVKLTGPNHSWNEWLFVAGQKYRAIDRTFWVRTEFSTRKLLV